MNYTKDDRESEREQWASETPEKLKEESANEIARDLERCGVSTLGGFLKYIMNSQISSRIIEGFHR